MLENSKRQNFVRQVHLGLYGTEAFRILSKIGEVIKEHGTKLDKASFRTSELARTTDNEIVFNVYNDQGWMYSFNKSVFADSGSRKRDDKSVRVWLAGVVKGFAKAKTADPMFNIFDLHKAEIAANEEWRPDNDRRIALVPDKYFTDNTPTEGNSCTVAQAYTLYSLLKGRKLSDKTFASDTVKLILGEAFDPVRTELENFRQEEMKRIDLDYAAERNAIEKWYESEIDKIRTMRHDKYAAAQAKATEDKAKVNAEIDASLKEAFPEEPSKPIEVDLSEAA